MNKRLDVSLFPKILFFWYITIFLSTEILSYFSLINRSIIILINISFILFVFYLFRQRINGLLKEVFIRRKIFTYVVVGILALTFIQGFLSAPNTTDSMVRRLPIVMYWVQEHTLYQDIIRNGHDFMGPFAEYIFLHLYLIFNGDRMLFFSQWIAFVGVISLSLLIAQELGASFRLSSFITLFITTLPIAVLQATSVQTDMVTTVMVLFSLYFALTIIKRPSLMNFLMLSFAVGLGILSKSIFLLYLIIPLGILLPYLLKYWKRSLLFGILSLLIIAIIQARFTEQNLRLYGGVLGSSVLQGNSGYTNEIITLQVTLSNLVRNLVVQVPFPVGKEIVEKLVITMHEKIGLVMDDPRTNFYDTKFSVNPVIFPQEDRAGNPIHLIVIFLSAFLLIIHFKKTKKESIVVYLYLLSLVSFLIFSTILKWQPFHSRLLMPFFIVGSITSVIIISIFEELKGLLNFLMSASIIISFLLIVLNVSKPYVSYKFFYSYVEGLAPPLSSIPESIFIKDREEHMFNARYYWYPPYKEIMEKTRQYQLPGTITFNLMDEFEYPMWYLLKKHNRSLKVVPYSKKIDGTIIVTTSKVPPSLEGYKTECVKTEIDYGYACISKKQQLYE